MKQKIAIALMLGGGILSQAAHAQTELPVYQVVKVGATDAEANALTAGLLLPAVRQANQGGLISRLDTTKFLTFPHREAARSPEMVKLMEGTVNKAPEIPIRMQPLDIAALDKITPVDDRVAIDAATKALKTAGLEPEFGTPTIGHNILSFLSQGADGNWVTKSKVLDTSVIYKFTDPKGIQFVGPGAQVQITFAQNGVSRLNYSAYKMRAGQGVKIVPEDEIDRRILKLAPQGSKISKRLVYWCPPLRSWLPNSKAGPVSTILPYYAYCTSTEQKTATGELQVIKSRINMIPATDDRRFVAAADVTATANGAQVSARVNVMGGVAPYTIIWGGSDPRVSFTNESSIQYTATRRWLPDMALETDLSLRRAETVSATIIDANGVQTLASATVPVTAMPNAPGSHNAQTTVPELYTALNSSLPPLGSKPTFGCFNPADPGEWTCCRLGWQSVMLLPGLGSGTQKFCWMGDDAWPGDFVEPKPAGSAMAKPWINGDADYENWGVNTADLVLHIGDGNSDGFTQMQPGAPLSKYATAWVGAPVYQPTMNINGNGFGTPKGFNVDYKNSWGPTGPNDNLNWLLMDDCDTLDPKGSGNLNVAQRWAPAFNGVHIFAGFATTETGNGPFEHDVAANMLGMFGEPQTILQSWFNASMSNDTGESTAMGPAVQISIFTFTDMEDFYWGKGSVGPTIVPSQWPAKLLSYWYLRGTNPAVLVFP